MLIVLKCKKQQKDGNSTKDVGPVAMTTGTQTNHGDPEYITTSQAEQEVLRYTVAIIK